MSISYNLLLDDIRFPKDCFLYKENEYLVKHSKIPNGCWKLAKDYKQFVKIVEENGIPEVVSLDNDLDPSHYKLFFKTESTGYFDWQFIKPPMGIHCLDYLIKECKREKRPLPTIYIHTANPHSAVSMRVMIEEYKNWLGPKCKIDLDIWPNYATFASCDAI